MKRFLLLLVVGAAAAIGIWYAMRTGGLRTSSANVTALLPKETTAFLHVPDVNGTRAKWHETDLYKLWREPALQDFLQKPLSKTPKSEAVRHKLQQIEALQMKDAFLAITSWENNQLKMLGGFRFKGTAEEAEKVISQWRARIQQTAPEVKHETLTYEKHPIDVVSHDAITVATVYNGDWFFAANDVPALKTLLDRADGRVKDAATTLATDENFTAAFKHMPASYAAFAYGRLDRYFARLATALPQDGSTSEQLSLLRQIRSVAGATGFENGKVRDVLFVGMPKAKDTGDLTRWSLALTSPESFLYIASFLNLPNQMPDAQKAAANGFPAAMQGLLTAFTAKGITLDYWKSAFGSELGLIGDWPQNARLPALFASLQVKDATKAKEIMTTVAETTAEESAWTTSEKEGVQYYSQPPTNPMVPLAPTIGLSNQLFIAGLDSTSVEAAIKRGGSTSSGLTASQTLKSAERLVPAPKSSFAYIDSAMFYTRLDAAVRPMLIMAAAFMPNVAETVDLGKLPTAEVIAKHLSPIVMSQAYQGDGYMTESVGPVSIYQAAIGIAAVTGMGAAFYQHQTHGGGLDKVSAPAVSLSPNPDETPEPES